MRSRVALVVLAAACRGPAPSRPVQSSGAQPARVVTPAPSVSEPPPPPDLRTSLFAKLEPRAAEQTLILGLHIEEDESYGSLFGDTGAPRSEAGPGYRSYALRFAGGAVSLQRELPYLVVPTTKGPLYIGEATVHQDHSGHESEAEQELIQRGESTPEWYLATRIWQTRDEQRIPKLIMSLEAKLSRAIWGTLHSESVEYVTPRVLVLSTDEANWTGGATAFQGTNRLQTRSLDTPIAATVLARNGRTELEKMAQAILREQRIEPDEFAGVDQPLQLGVGDSLVLTSDAQACLTRFEGKVWEAGCVVVPGNSARSFTEAFRIRPALPDLAPSNFAPLELADVKQAFPDVQDVVVAPSQAFVLLLRDTGLSVLDVASRRELLNLPTARGKIVMAEWVESALAPLRH